MGVSRAPRSSSAAAYRDGDFRTDNYAALYVLSMFVVVVSDLFSD